MEYQTDPTALAAKGVLVSLLNKLEEKGIFSTEEIREMLDAALAGLETSGRHGPDADAARIELDDWIALFSPSSPNEASE